MASAPNTRLIAKALTEVEDQILFSLSDAEPAEGDPPPPPPATGPPIIPSNNPLKLYFRYRRLALPESALQLADTAVPGLVLSYGQKLVTGMTG
jgi:hypothetical protein